MSNDHRLHQAVCETKASGLSPNQPVLERLGLIAARGRDTTDLLDLFRARLNGAPSVFNRPEPVSAVQGRDDLPTSLDDLLTFVENVQFTNLDRLQEIAARF